MGRLSKKKLMYTNGQNSYYVINPEWFKVFIVLGIAMFTLLVIFLVIVITGIMWIDDLNIISRLFALVEGAI